MKSSTTIIITSLILTNIIICNLYFFCCISVGVAKNKDEFWAKRLHECMNGLGTDDKALINILVARSEVDLGNIKIEFVKIYEKTLNAWIEDESSGDYKKMLLALVSDS